jgi:hypothetical protein
VNIRYAPGHLTDLADIPERRNQQHFEREHQAPSGISAKAAVLGHARRDQRMGQLQQQRAQPAQGYDPLAADAPGYRVGAGQPRVTGRPGGQRRHEPK